jgi:hypothetical protein
LKKKTRGKKSRDTVPLRTEGNAECRKQENRKREKLEGREEAANQVARERKKRKNQRTGSRK